MAYRRLKGDLSIRGIDNIIKGLENYKLTLNEKCEEVVSRLADVGISIAVHYTGQFASFITFTKEVQPNANGYTAIMYGTNSARNVSKWYTQEGEKTAEISSILMAEFGSGAYAVEGHRGTFPNQKHAFQDAWWYATAVDENGKPTKWVKSSGIHPTMPMYNASLEMRATVHLIVSEVFAR